jgi:predicted GIY-YIG superfamily endonuclease
MSADDIVPPPWVKNDSPKYQVLEEIAVSPDDLKKLATKRLSGVYVVLGEKETLYVGESSNIYSRLHHQHRLQSDWWKDAKCINITSLKDSDQKTRRKLELQLLLKERPTKNIKYAKYFQLYDSIETYRIFKVSHDVNSIKLVELCADEWDKCLGENCVYFRSNKNRCYYTAHQTILAPEYRSGYSWNEGGTLAVVTNGFPVEVMLAERRKWAEEMINQQIASLRGYLARWDNVAVGVEQPFKSKLLATEVR